MSPQSVSSITRQWPSILNALFASILVAMVTNDGLNLTHDSRYYLAAAESISAGRGFFADLGLTPTFDGYLSVWPPLYSILLTVLPAQWINIIAAALTALLFGAFVQRHTNRAWVPSMAIVLLILSTPLHFVVQHAWTEPLFIFWTMAFLVAVDRGRWGWAAVIVGAACMTRYIGITLAMTGVVMLLWRRRWIDAVRFGTFGLSPLALWALRNYLLTETLLGPRSPSQYTVMDNVIAVGLELIVWMMPVILVAFPAMHLRRFRRLPAAVAPAGLFGLLYTTFLVVSASNVAYDSIGPRLMAPVFIPLLIVCILSLDGIITRSTAQPHYRRHLWPSALRRLYPHTGSQTR